MMLVTTHWEPFWGEVGAKLDTKPYAIFYASWTLDEAQVNYAV